MKYDEEYKTMIIRLGETIAGQRVDEVKMLKVLYENPEDLGKVPHWLIDSVFTRLSDPPRLIALERIDRDKMDDRMRGAIDTEVFHVDECRRHLRKLIHETERKISGHYVVERMIEESGLGKLLKILEGQIDQLIEKEEAARHGKRTLLNTSSTEVAQTYAQEKAKQILPKGQTFQHELIRGSLGAVLFDAVRYGMELSKD